MKIRNIELDATRGVAILLVLMGHAIQYSTGGISDPVFQVVATFWMPLFFILSGYADGLTGGGSLGARFRRLVVPYLFWTSVAFLIHIGMGRLSLSLANYAHEVFFSGLWFLRVLFLVWLPCYCFRLVKLRFNMTAAVFTFAGISSCIIVFLCESVAHYLPLYLLGLALQTQEHRLSRRVQNLLLVCSVFLMTGLVCLYFVCEQGIVHRLTDLAMAICGSATAFAAIRFWASKAKLVMKALSWIGRYTLELYAVHVSLLLAFRIGFRNWPLTFLLWCCLSGVIIALLGRVPFLASVAFGRKWNLPFKRRSATVEL